MFTSLEEIETYINKCDKKDLGKAEILTKTYLLVSRICGTQVNYKVKVIYKHVQAGLVVSNKSLIG